MEISGSHSQSGYNGGNKFLSLDEPIAETVRVTPKVMVTTQHAA
jgi:hypothetical protein